MLNQAEEEGIGFDWGEGDPVSVAGEQFERYKKVNPFTQMRMSLEEAISNAEQLDFLYDESRIHLIDRAYRARRELFVNNGFFTFNARLDVEDMLYEEKDSLFDMKCYFHPKEFIAKINLQPHNSQVFLCKKCLHDINKQDLNSVCKTRGLNSILDLCYFKYGIFQTSSIDKSKTNVSENLLKSESIKMEELIVHINQEKEKVHNSFSKLKEIFAQLLDDREKEAIRLLHQQLETIKANFAFYKDKINHFHNQADEKNTEKTDNLLKEAENLCSYKTANLHNLSLDEMKKHLDLTAYLMEYHNEYYLSPTVNDYTYFKMLTKKLKKSIEATCNLVQVKTVNKVIPKQRSKHRISQQRLIKECSNNGDLISFINYEKFDVEHCNQKKLYQIKKIKHKEDLKIMIIDRFYQHGYISTQDKYLVYFDKICRTSSNLKDLRLQLPGLTRSEQTFKYFSECLAKNFVDLENLDIKFYRKVLFKEKFLKLALAVRKSFKKLRSFNLYITEDNPDAEKIEIAIEELFLKSSDIKAKVGII